MGERLLQYLYKGESIITALVLLCSILWDLLFFHYDTLPATVPVAAALMILETRKWATRPRRGAYTAS